MRELCMARLVASQEEEPRRLSRELHNQTAQRFVALAMVVDAMMPLMDGLALCR